MSTRVRLVFLGDIHGNLPALDAVMADLDAQTPDGVYLLGDLVNRCPWTDEVMERLAETDWPSVQGNHDLILSVLNTPQVRPPFDVPDRFPLINWTWQRLSAEHIRRLGALPAELLIDLDDAPPLRLMHGVPGNSFVGMLPEDSDDTLQGYIRSHAEPIIICGHTHRPMDRTLPSGQRVLNGGSVGMPYNGDPRAQYMLLDLVPSAQGMTWRATFRQVDYPQSEVLTAYEESKLLETGGPLAQLYARTVQDGQPWASDFAFWLKHQPDSLRRTPQQAVERYLDMYGPHHWAFFNHENL